MGNFSYFTIHVLSAVARFLDSCRHHGHGYRLWIERCICIATQEAIRARQKHRFESETPEAREDLLARQRACRRERIAGIASETAEQRETRFTADRARRKRRITSESIRQRYASLDAALEVLSKLLRSTIQALCNGKER